VRRTAGLMLAAALAVGLASPATASTDPLAGVSIAPHQKHGGYRRAAFGTGWENGTGCDTRDQILARDLVDVTTRGCKVETGTLHDPYTGVDISFTRGEQTSAAVQIDHLVPLAYAWDMGASQWPDDKRHRFYSDPDELLAVSGKANEEKADYPPGAWMPSNAAYDCEYDRRFVTVLRTYSLPIDPASAAAVRALPCD
jgi:hypothetical protein